METPEKLHISQDVWVENQPSEIFVTKDELLFQSEEKEKREIELAIINDELMKAQTNIVVLNEELEYKVTERTAQLESANKALEAFSYSVSHDLRAPVRAVTSFSQIILTEYGAKMGPKVKELFGYIITSMKRMSAILDDLLRLAKYSKEKLKIVPVDMTYLVKEVWSNIYRAAPHTALLELADLPVVQADLSMIEQAVTNLLSNAIKYSSKKENPLITIWSEQTKGMIIFYIKDNGTGFDMCNYGRLFEAFQRLHGMNDFEGTGVGLTVVKSIVEKHGGTVGAKGKVGEGATFHFALPVR